MSRIAPGNLRLDTAGICSEDPVRTDRTGSSSKGRESLSGRPGKGRHDHHERRAPIHAATTGGSTDGWRLPAGSRIVRGRGVRNAGDVEGVVVHEGCLVH